ARVNRPNCLFLVHPPLTSSFNNLHGPGRTPKLLKRQVKHNKTSLIVRELCIGDGTAPSLGVHVMRSRCSLVPYVSKVSQAAGPCQRTTIRTRQMLLTIA